ncbi:MAG TPA: helix-turn-helix transcriptional regulator [Azospirillaceae bacterium]|nr:helix-turn-helix transcriptional regulator [Azospirillaceae bacterium]
MITAAQCRAARALLNITQEDLSKASGVSLPTIKDFERGARNPQARTLRDLRNALEGLGVRLLDEPGEGVMRA